MGKITQVLIASACIAIIGATGMYAKDKYDRWENDQMRKEVIASMRKFILDTAQEQGYGHMSLSSFCLKLQDDHRRLDLELQRAGLTKSPFGEIDYRPLNYCRDLDYIR